MSAHLLALQPQPCPARPVSGRRALIATVAMYVAGFIAVANISTIYLALPGIERAFHGGNDEQEWIVGIYPLMEGGFALAAGTLGDVFGRRRVLAIGIAMFLVGSVACMFAPNAAALVFARAFQGIGSAAMLALPIAILVQMLPNPRDNANAIKTFTLVIGIAAGAAPLIAGFVVDWFSWTGIFGFSAIFALVAFAGLFAVDENTCAPSATVDFWGQGLSVVAFLAISYVVIKGKGLAIEPGSFVAVLGVAAVAFALFVMVERRVKNPAVPLKYFDRRGFNVALLTLGVVNFGWYGLMLVCTMALERTMHQDPIAIGLYLTPCNAAFFIANAFSARVERRAGISAAIAAGFGVSLAAMAWMAIPNAMYAPWLISAALCVAGVGWGLLCTPATSLGMASVGTSDEGFASAMLVLSRSLCGVLGVAVLGEMFVRGTHSAAIACFVLTFVAGCVLVGSLRNGNLLRSDADLPVV